MSTFWGITINNPDENDYAIIRNGYADYCRELVWTKEIGATGTEHIQAWVKLQRQQRFSFVKKLFPKAHLVCLGSAEYVLRTKEYVQKNDETTAGLHVHKFHEPLQTIESVVRDVADQVNRSRTKWGDDRTISRLREDIERNMVIENYKLAKLFVSAAYKQMWKQFGEEMVAWARENVDDYEDGHVVAVEDSKESSVVIDTTNNADVPSQGDEEGLSRDGGTEAEDCTDYTQGASEDDDTFDAGSRE